MFTDTVPESSTERKNAPSSPQRPNSRNPRTCVTCKRRKVKCDRKTPCANCIKAQIQCIYPPPGRAPRQAKRGMKVLEKGILPELVDQVWSMMTRVMEQSMNPEMAALKQSVGEPSSQPREPGLKNEQSSRPTSMRVVGMDEAMESTLSDPASRGITLGSESSQSQLLTHLAERRPGQLVLGEGKSQYIPSPFWASMSEVCITCLDVYLVAKIHDRLSKRGYKKYLKNVRTSPMTIRLSCLPIFPSNPTTIVL